MGNKIRRYKKAALNLSVNAIVVFVLAFAMLGVGIAFVNVIRENILGTGADIIDVGELERPPSADRPLTVPDEINLPMTDGTDEKVGFYNRRDVTAENAVIGITECTGTGGLDDIDPDSLPDVSSLPVDLERGERTGFLIYVGRPNIGGGGEFDIGTYICQMAALNAEDDNEIYETKSFYLRIVA